MKLQRLSFGCTTLLSVVLAAATARADDPHHPSGRDLLDNVCRPALDAGQIAMDGDWQSNEVPMPSKGGGDLCSGYTWTQITGAMDSLTLAAFYGGPDINRFSDDQNAWDCNHSSMEYAVFVKRDGVFKMEAYGDLFGKYANNHCSHDGSASPSVGSFIAHVFHAGDVRVAFRSWQHNDMSIGHTGTYCGDLSCWWPSVLVWSSQSHF
jgi:hypothetical protein